MFIYGLLSGFLLSSLCIAKPISKKNIFKKLGPMGPPGPPGPGGPPGPPGAQVTLDVMMKEFKELVKAEAERRAERILVEKCPSCAFVKNSTHNIVEMEDIHFLPRITSGFHLRLRGNIYVQRKTFLELKDFHRPFGGGAFQRGNVFVPEDGRFTAPRDGVYQFTVNIHLAHDGFRGRKRQGKLGRRDTVRVLICIQSLCQKHTSLEFISGMESNSRVFTISVSGLLHLEAGQYTSIYVDNGSRKAINVLEGSDFSGILVGV